LAANDIAFAYVDAEACSATDVLTLMGAQLGTDHPPYDAAENGWLRFMDDLETLPNR
jgi:hypothetical protein